MAFERGKSVIFVSVMKRTALIISYWTVALILFATVLSSTGYTLPDAFFLASSLLPVAVLFRYQLAQIRFTSRWQGIRDICFLMLFIQPSDFSLQPSAISHQTLDFSHD
jgi:hypothetical protein